MVIVSFHHQTFDFHFARFFSTLKRKFWLRKKKTKVMPTIAEIADQLLNKQNIVVVCGCKNDDVPEELFIKGDTDALHQWIAEKKESEFASGLLTTLSEQGKLLRVYTRNCDWQERHRDIDDTKFVNARGTYRRFVCSECGTMASSSRVLSDWAQSLPSKCRKCDGDVRPAMIFYNEKQTEHNIQCMSSDVKDADCIVLLGYKHKDPTGFLMELWPIVFSSAPTLVVDASDEDVAKLNTLIDETRAHHFQTNQKAIQQAVERLNSEIEREKTKIKKCVDAMEAEKQRPKTTLTSTDLVTSRFISLIPRLLAAHK